MNNNKEIITQIIDSLDLEWPTAWNSKLTRDKLIECWSTYRKDPDYKYYGYSVPCAMSAAYTRLFNGRVDKKLKREQWSRYILRLNNYKFCPPCGELKTLDKFSRSSKTVSKLQNTCITCEKSYYSSVKEKQAVSRKEYRDNPINKKRHAYTANKWRTNNGDKCRDYCAKRRAAKLNRTPKWLTDIDKKEIQSFYTKALELERLHGIKYHVDHDIPLQGELVSGLHVPLNLRVIPATENLGKSNSYTTG